MTDLEHVKKLRDLAKALNKAASDARKDGLTVELYPNGENEPVEPYVQRVHT